MSIFQFSKFISTGIALQAVGIGIFASLYSLFGEKVAYPLIYLASYLVGFVLSFFVYRAVVFQSRRRVWRPIFIYFLSTQLSLWVSLSLLVVAVQSFLIHPVIAQIAIALVLSPIMYFFSSKVTFRKERGSGYQSD